MKDVFFGEKILERELVQNADSFPTEINKLTLEIAREAGLEGVLHIAESPDSIAAAAFVQNLWARTTKM